MTKMNEDELQDVQDKIDEARHKAIDHGVLPENDEREEEQREDEEEARDGLTRPGLG
jgi:hypothetical protein